MLSSAKTFCATRAGKSPLPRPALLVPKKVTDLYSGAPWSWNPCWSPVRSPGRREPECVSGPSIACLYFALFLKLSPSWLLICPRKLGDVIAWNSLDVARESSACYIFLQQGFCFHLELCKLSLEKRRPRGSMTAALKYTNGWHATCFLWFLRAAQMGQNYKEAN